MTSNRAWRSRRELEPDSDSDSSDSTSSDTDSESNSSDSRTGTSDSDSSSSDSESDDSSGSDSVYSDDEELASFLKKHSLGNETKKFSRAKIFKVKDAQLLSERKLQKIGFTNKSTRRRLVNVFEKSKKTAIKSEVSTSSDEEVENGEPRKIFKDILERVGMGEYATMIIQKGGIEDVHDAYRLKDKHLKRLGVLIDIHRAKIIKGLRQHRRRNLDAKMDSDDETGLDKVYKVLRKAGLSHCYKALKRYDVNSIPLAKQMTHVSLKEMGFLEYKDRRQIMDAFKNYQLEYISSSSSATVSCSTGTSSEEENGMNSVERVLHNCRLSKYVHLFDRANIKTIREARALSNTKLRSLGVKLYLEREKLIEGFQEYEVNNKSIKRLLAKLNLERYENEFSKFLDVEDCKKLTYGVLKDMGIPLHGQRQRLMEAIQRYKPASVRRSEKKTYRKAYRVKGLLESDSDNDMRDIDNVLTEQHFSHCIPDFGDVKTLKQGMNLTSSQLQKMGVPISQQHGLLKAFERAKIKQDRRRLRKRQQKEMK